VNEREVLRQWLDRMPVIAILRGLKPEHARETAQTLLHAGICIMEVPLNVEGAEDSIALICDEVGDAALVGGGTVRTLNDLDKIASIGARFAVMPHLDASLVIGALDIGLIPVPGVFTPSEAFAALDAGAGALKMFPAEILSPKGLAAWRAVMSRDEALLIPTGGVSAENVAAWWQAGADGCGVGSAVFDAGGDMAETEQRARTFVAALNHARDRETSV
jgi:2-dehydro-3-deoxyphosphogalactonate aldolase